MPASIFSPDIIPKPPFSYSPGIMMSNNAGLMSICLVSMYTLSCQTRRPSGATRRVRSPCRGRYLRREVVGVKRTGGSTEGVCHCCGECEYCESSVHVPPMISAVGTSVQRKESIVPTGCQDLQRGIPRLPLRFGEEDAEVGEPLQDRRSFDAQRKEQAAY